MLLAVCAMSLPRYAEYKDSGLVSLGLVPSHWQIAPLKQFFHIVGGSTPKSDNGEFWDGDIVWVSPADLSKLDSLKISDSARKITTQGLASCGTTLVPTGSLVLSTRAPIGSLAIAGVELCTNQGCKSLVPTGASKSNFYAYMLLASTEQLNLRGKGTTFLELSADELGAFRVVRPPLAEQSAIAAFLDRETGKIDALIAEQEKLLTLLAEKRQATISHAVTRGLTNLPGANLNAALGGGPKGEGKDSPSHTNATMKDSGVPWLGEVPAHWGVAALSYLSQIETGSTPDRSEPRYWNGSIPWLKTGEINWTPICESEEFISHEGLANSAAKIAKPATLLMAMYGQGVTRGRVALLEIEAAYNQACAAIVFGPHILPEFGRYFFMAAYDHIRNDGNETSQMNLSAGAIAKIKLPVPPLNEQVAIIDALNSKVASMDELRGNAESAIALLKERRSALIAAAVTGKVDVRGSVPIRTEPKSHEEAV